MNPNTKLNKLNIACIYNSSLSDWQGCAAGLKNMLHIFESARIKINLISYSYKSNKFSIEHENINPLLNSTTIHIPPYLPNFLKGFSIFLAFSCAWKPTKKCDIIFADAGILSAIPAVIFSRIFGKPVILHYIDQTLHHIPETVYKHIVKNADIIFAISPYLINKAEGYGCKNIVYLPSFVDTNLFNVNKIARKKVRDDLRIEEFRRDLKQWYNPFN